MARTILTKAQVRLQLLVADSATFANKSFDEVINLDQSTEEAFTNRIFHDAAVTDQAVPLGSVNSPTLIYVRFLSSFDGTGGTTEDDSAPVTIKIDGGTASQTNHVLLAVDDQTNDKVTSTITYSTATNSDTEVTILVIGRKS